MSRTVGFDAASRISGFTHNNAAFDQSFGYDNLSRLTSWSGLSTSQSFGYDLTGNRTNLTIGASSYPYTAQATSNRVTRTAGPGGVKSFGFDAAGNTTSAGSLAFGYDARGRMLSASTPLGPVSYQVNALAQRVAKTVAGVTTRYHFDANGNLIGESGATNRDYAWLGTVPVAILEGASAYFIHADHLDTPRVVTTAANTTIWRWDGDPFGFLPASEDPDGNGQPFTLNLRFPGQYFDKETNLHYNYYRDYDPSTGRYIEPEPLGLVGDINLYRYSRNSPVRFFDPDGAQVIIPGGGVAPPPGGAAPGTPRKPRDDGSMSGLFPPNTFPPSNGNAVPSPDDPGDGRVPDRKPDLKPIPGEGTNPGPGPKQKGVCKFTGLATFEPSGCNARTLKCQYRCPNKGIKYLSATVYFDSANPAFLCEPTVPEFYFPWN